MGQVKIDLMSPRQRLQDRFQTAAWALGIFLLNLFLCRPLLRTEYVPYMFSIEAAYIALTRWVGAHWNELSWFPLWNDGEPFQNTYQPGLGLLSALTANVLHVSPALGYHITIGIIYCLGPVGLFLLAERLSGRRETGILAALLFTLVSPSAFLVPVIRHDLGSVWFLRRYQAMVYYGEGPNVCGLSLVPFGLFMIDGVYRRGSAVRFFGAAVTIGLIVLVSWPASVVLAMGTVAYLLSRDWEAWKVLRWKLARLAALAIAAYLLIAPWDLPSTIQANQRNSQMIGGDYHYTPAHLLYFGLIAGMITAAMVMFRRWKADRYIELAFYWFVMPGAVALAAHWANIAILPQPERFHLGMEFGLVLLAAWLLSFLIAPGKLRIAGIAVLAIAAIFQTVTVKRYTRRLTGSIDIRQTYEYQTAQWLDANLHGQRVFAAGSLAFWMNAWTDQAQATGCCLPGMPNPMDWIVSWIVPTGFAAGTHDAEISVLWMRAWGAQAVIVGGEKTRNAFHDWPHPMKFEDLLPKIWEQGDDRVYRIPSRTASLAHVITANEVVKRAPVNGLDVEPLRPFVHALEDPAYPLATWTWKDQHEARIEANLRPGDWISVQETMLPGWHASMAGRPLEIRGDGLGLMVLNPKTSGATRIDLVYDGGTESKLFRMACVACWFGLMVWSISSFGRRSAEPDAKSFYTEA